MAEDFGVQGRGRFYEEVGALRDVIENHLFQTVGAAGDGAAGRARRRGAARRQGAACSRAMETLKPDDLVRGQFEGYRDEQGVAPDSDVETFAAVRLHIDSWRWAGVPFYIRAGKNLPVDVHRGARRAAPSAAGGVRRVRADAARHQLLPLPAQPAASSIALGVRVEGAGRRLHGRQTSSCTSATTTRARRRPYERLLGDAIDGETLLFAREDGVEASWRVVDNVLTDHGPAYPVPGAHVGPDGAGPPHRGPRPVARPEPDSTP